MDNKRSPNYPSIGLQEAISLAKQLWDREKKSQVPSEVAARAWGYKGQNGVSRMKLASLKKFGLLEGRGGDGVRLTDLAMHLVTYPLDSAEYYEAKNEAARKPELFAEVLQTHPHASNENLQAYLITRKGFSASGAKQFVKAFRETVELVNPQEPSDNSPMEPQITQASVVPSTRSGGPAVPSPPLARAGQFTISMGNLSVSVFVAGEDLTFKHLELVRQYLAVAEAQLKIEAESKKVDLDDDGE